MEEGRVEEVDVSKQLARQQAEEKRLAEMMIPKKHRRLYNKIAYKKKKITQEVSGICCFMGQKGGVVRDDDEN